MHNSNAKRFRKLIKFCLMQKREAKYRKKQQKKKTAEAVTLTKPKYRNGRTENGSEQKAKRLSFDMFMGFTVVVVPKSHYLCGVHLTMIIIT